MAQMDTHTPMKAGLRKLMIAFGVGLLVAVGAALGVGLASDLKRTECNHPTVVTYEEALAAGRRLNCTFLHDDPNYAQQLSATFAANDLGDGPTTEYSQREYDSHIAVIAPAQRALLDECLGESAGGRSERRRLDSCPQGVCPPVFAASISTWPGHLSNGKNVYVDAGVTHTFSLPENPDTCWASSCPQPCAGCIRKDGYCSTLYRDGIRLRRFPSNDAERCYDNGGTWANGVAPYGSWGDAFYQYKSLTDNGNDATMCQVQPTSSTGTLGPGSYASPSPLVTTWDVYCRRAGYTVLYLSNSIGGRGLERREGCGPQQRDRWCFRLNIYVSPSF